MTSVIVAAIVLVSGCSDDEANGSDCPVGSEGCPCTGGGACDPGLDCIDDACGSAGGDSDVDSDTDSDTGAAGACVDEIAGGVLTDELRLAIADAAGACGRTVCLECILGTPDRCAGAAGHSCPGDDCTVSGCMLRCIRENSSGDPNMATVNASGVDDACLRCSTDVTQCVSDGGCVIPCMKGGCECDTCECDAGCPDAFAACSGDAAYLDCPPGC